MMSRALNAAHGERISAPRRCLIAADDMAADRGGDHAAGAETAQNGRQQQADGGAGRSRGDAADGLRRLRPRHRKR